MHSITTVYNSNFYFITHLDIHTVTLYQRFTHSSHIYTHTQGYMDNQAHRPKHAQRIIWIIILLHICKQIYVHCTLTLRIYCIMTLGHYTHIPYNTSYILLCRIHIGLRPTQMLNESVNEVQLSTAWCSIDFVLYTAHICAYLLHVMTLGQWSS